jgi:hypothetical protein
MEGAAEGSRRASGFELDASLNPYRDIAPKGRYGVVPATCPIFAL